MSKMNAARKVRIYKRGDRGFHAIGIRDRSAGPRSRCQPTAEQARHEARAHASKLAEAIRKLELRRARRRMAEDEERELDLRFSCRRQKP